ncbi:hypothetical protein LLE87_38580, partial [Paenibacillus polymyxa]|nr:hypothetical protein [Paenibacillus polymyxa]
NLANVESQRGPAIKDQRVPAGRFGGVDEALNHAVYVTGADSVIINAGAIMAGPVNQDTAIKYAGTASNATLMLREGSV